MSELWRHTLERLSAELEKINEAGNDRQGQYPAPRPRAPQRQRLLPAPQARSAAGQPNQARILDAIPEPHHVYLPARRQEPLPVRPNGYARRNYAHQDLQIEVLPPPREWRPRPIQAREAGSPRGTGSWGKVLAASFFGTVLGMGSYALLFQGGAEKGEAAKAHMSPVALANAGQPPRVAPGDAFRERVSSQFVRTDVPGAGAGYGNPLGRGDAPGAGAGYGAMAQSPGDAFLERASNRLPPGDAPRLAAPPAIPQQPDEALLAQASYKLGHGDVLGARAAFETVAQRGGSLGAFGLAETYDPNVLARRRVLGLKPDAGLARLWYERAAQLGSAEASQRLKKLTKPARAVSLPKPASLPQPISSSQAVSSGSEVLRAR